MKYPNILFFRFKKYSEIDNYLLNSNYRCNFNIIDNPNDLNKLFDPNYHLLITFGDTEKEYHNYILPNIVNRFANRWIHKSREGILNIEEFNSNVNYCYINNVIMERKLQRPEFSIFTTCYNTWDKFDRVYNSIKNQKLKDWEWVIIDDTPLPKYNEKNHFDFLREKCKNDSRIRLYCRSENSGNIGNVKNEAVSLCRGKYILELDHDDEILPDCLVDAANEFHDEEVGFVYMDFINIYENGDNFLYGDFICKGYGGYYCQKYNNKWVNVYITPNINNITLSHLVCCPNHPRIWRKSVLLRLENYSEFLPICDDYEILLKTALNTKIVKIHKLGYIQYMNDGNSNFSLIRNSEINRIGPYHIFPQFYEMYNVNENMKKIDAYENENFIENLSQIWKRENYQHKFCNKIVNHDYTKQYCLIGEDTLEMNDLRELYKNKANSFIILSNTLEIERLQELLDSKGYGDMRCYSLLDCNREELERYFMLLCKCCDNFEIINSNSKNNNVKKNIYIINNNNIGGSYKYLTDIINIYKNNNYILIKSLDELININFIEKDIILVQSFLYTNISSKDILDIYNKYLCKIIIPIHDFIWLCKNIHEYSEDIPSIYLNNNIEINEDIFMLFKIAYKIIANSQFTYNIYKKYFNNINIDISYYNDYNIDYNIINIPTINNNCINIGVFSPLCRYKGERYIKHLKNIYENDNIKFCIVGDNIPYYKEKEFYDHIKKYNINGFLLLNEWGETYCYLLTKIINSGLPLLYNNFGALKERLIDIPEHYFKVYDKEQQDNIDFSILEQKFNDFIRYIYKNNGKTQNMLEDFTIKPNNFYNKLFK